MEGIRFELQIKSANILRSLNPPKPRAKGKPMGILCVTTYTGTLTLHHRIGFGARPIYVMVKIVLVPTSYFIQMNGHTDRRTPHYKT